MISAPKYMFSPVALLLLALFYSYGCAADPCISWGVAEIEVVSADGNKTRTSIVARIFPGAKDGTIELIHGYTKGILLFNVNGIARVNLKSLNPIKITCLPEQMPSTGRGYWIESEPMNLSVLEKIAHGDRAFGKASQGIRYVIKDGPEGKDLARVADLEAIEITYLINGETKSISILLQKK